MGVESTSLQSREVRLLRGRYPARVDEKGRLKIPSAFLQFLQANFGPEVFVTSLTGENIMVYPMEIWVGIEQKVAAVPSTHFSKNKYFKRLNYYGQSGSLDRQGRLLIPATLRESAQMSGDVDVLGLYNFLEIWNHKRIKEQIDGDPLTEEDLNKLSDLGI
jgi:MraZ protein